jgi:hypothetical protein
MVADLHILQLLEVHSYKIKRFMVNKPIKNSKNQYFVMVVQFLL